MIEQILDRFARLERSRRRWQWVSITLAVVLIVAMAVAGMVILRLREVAFVERRRADRLEREACKVVEHAKHEAAAAREQAQQVHQAHANP